MSSLDKAMFIPIKYYLLGILFGAMPAYAQFGSCGPGDGECCSGNGTPGCDDQGTNCCALVCACDPFCCETAWDEDCANFGVHNTGCGAQLLCAECIDTDGDGVPDSFDVCCNTPTGLAVDDVGRPKGDLDDDCDVDVADFAVFQANVTGIMEEQDQACRRDLSVNLTSEAGSIQPNAQAIIDASLIGGAPPYTVCYNDSDGIGNILGGGSSCGPITVGGTTYSKCVCSVGSSDAGQNGTVPVHDFQTYQAPNFGGNALIRVAVEDQVGNVATASLGITVISLPPGPVTVALSVADPQVCLGDNTIVTATAQGGVTPYTFTYSLVGTAAAGELLAPTGETSQSTATYTAPTDPVASRTISVFVTEPGFTSATASITINPATVPSVSFSPSTRDVCYSSTSPITAVSGLDVLISNDVATLSFNWLARGQVVGFPATTLTPASVFDDPSARGAVFNVTQAVDDLVALSGGAFTLAEALLNGTSFTVRIEVTDKCGTVSADQELQVAKTVVNPAALIAPVDSCSDGAFCNGVETCSLGICGNGTPPACPSACAESAIDPFFVCIQCDGTNDGIACNDGDLCTTSDICTLGVCVGTAVSCSFLDDQCLLGVCNAGTCVATNTNEANACNDGSLCTTTDVCTAGVCAGTATDCSGLDGQCSVGVCNLGNGLCEAQSANEGNACNDLSLCTTGDACSSGTCTGTATDCSGLDDQCNAGVCNAGTGACESQTANEGNACTDGSQCTNGDICSSGTCVGEPANEGNICTDGDVCTDFDACSSGTCVGAPRDCSIADDQCNVGVCNALTGACEPQPANEGNGCNDGNLCTTTDVCASGTCAGTAVSCIAFDDQCNVGVCNVGNGACEAQAANNGGSCTEVGCVTCLCSAGTCP